MAVAIVQQNATSTTGAGIASGSAATVLASNTTAGNSVLLFIETLSTNYPQDVASVTSSMGTFVRLSASSSNGLSSNAYVQEAWYCANVTGTSRTITVTTISGGVYYAAAIEASGVGATLIGWNGWNDNALATATLSMTVPSAGCVAIIGNTTILTPTGGSWTSSSVGDWAASGGGWIYNIGYSYNSSIAAGAFTFTAATAESGGTNEWGLIGVILCPAGPTISAVMVYDDSNLGGAGSGSVAVSPQAVGNVLVVQHHTSGAYTTALSGGGVTTWHLAAQDTTDGSEIYWGVVTTAGSSTISYTWSAGTLWAGSVIELSSSYGSAVVWTQIAAHASLMAANATITFPSLIATATEQVYVGGAGENVTITAAGTTTGFTYWWDGIEVLCYNASLSAGTYAPTQTQSSSTAENISGVILQAAAAGSNPPLVTSRPRDNIPVMRAAFY